MIRSAANQFRSSVVAQVIPVPAPDGTFPGGSMIGKLLGYGIYLSLALSVGAVLYGGGSWAWSSWGNAGAATNGRKWVVGGMVGALLCGVAAKLIDGLFTAAGAA
jgi:hypothetical protein